jgi:hypothetical protein
MNEKKTKSVWKVQQVILPLVEVRGQSGTEIIEILLVMEDKASESLISDPSALTTNSSWWYCFSYRLSFITEKVPN